MLSHVIPQCLVTDRISIKLQLTGKSRLIFQFSATMTLTRSQIVPGLEIAGFLKRALGATTETRLWARRQKKHDGFVESAIIIIHFQG